MNYNKMIYESGPVKYKDFITDKYDKVHNKLYDKALYNYLYENNKNYINNVVYNIFDYINTVSYKNTEIINLENIKNYIKEGNNIITFNQIIDMRDNYLNLISVNNFIDENNQYIQNIKNLFNSLDISDYKKYIVYFTVNLLYLLEKTKTDITNITHITDISDFIFKYDNVYYVLSEDGLEILSEEIETDLIIYEDVVKQDIHISYNKEGKYILDINSEIYESLSQFIDELNLIMNKTNQYIINDILNIMTNNYINNHKIVELKNNEYDKPSKIIIYKSKYPYEKKLVDLTSYWDRHYQLNKKPYNNIKLLDENINDSIITSINYVSGEVEMYSKINDLKFNIDINRINENTEINADSIANLFSQKLKNI